MFSWINAAILGQDDELEIRDARALVESIRCELGCANFGHVGAPNERSAIFACPVCPTKIAATVEPGQQQKAFLHGLIQGRASIDYAIYLLRRLIRNYGKCDSQVENESIEQRASDAAGEYFARWRCPICKAIFWVYLWAADHPGAFASQIGQWLEVAKLINGDPYRYPIDQLQQELVRRSRSYPIEQLQQELARRTKS
jgi:hypothetical protein